MKETTIKSHVTSRELEEIADTPIAAFGHISPIKQARLLRLAANSLDRSNPVTLEAVTVAHQLASWAKDIESSVSRAAVCECGTARADCVCDRIAAEHYLATGDVAQLIALGWPHAITEALSTGEVTPTDLLTADCRNDYQKGATPVDIRVQSLW